MPRYGPEVSSYHPTMSILIAEDNVAQRHYLREILEKEFPSHARSLKPPTAKRQLSWRSSTEARSLHSRHSNAEALGRESRARNLARLPFRADNFLDAVSSRDLHQRDSQDR